MKAEEQRSAIAEAVFAVLVEYEHLTLFQHSDGTEGYRGIDLAGWWIYQRPDRSLYGTNYSSESECYIGNIQEVSKRNDYLNDLNAIQQAVLKLFPNQVRQGFYHPLWNSLMANLKIATGHQPDHWNEYDLMTASAAAWSQAIVKTLGKWKD